MKTAGESCPPTILRQLDGAFVTNRVHWTPPSELRILYETHLELHESRPPFDRMEFRRGTATPSTPPLTFPMVDHIVARCMLAGGVENEFLRACAPGGVASV